MDNIIQKAESAFIWEGQIICKKILFAVFIEIKRKTALKNKNNFEWSNR